MSETVKRVLTREAAVFASIFSIWLLTVIFFVSFVTNPSSSAFFNLSFYFLLLYCFYLLDRAAIWVIERFLIRGKKAARKLIDGVAIAFILASALGYFVVVFLYQLIF